MLLGGAQFRCLTLHLTGVESRKEWPFNDRVKEKSRGGKGVKQRRARRVRTASLNADGAMSCPPLHLPLPKVSRRISTPLDTELCALTQRGRCSHGEPEGW